MTRSITSNLVAAKLAGNIPDSKHRAKFAAKLAALIAII